MLVIYLKKTEEYIRSMLLVSVLTALSLAAKPVSLSGSMFSGGLLMILFSVINICDLSEKRSALIRLPLSVLFCLCSGKYYSALIFYKSGTEKKYGLMFPPAVCFICELFTGKSNMPHVIVKCLLVILVTLIMAALEKIVLMIIESAERRRNSDSVAAVRELYEKKLNQELTVKNYLADRNARLEERENISRNIHNNVGHTITAAIMTLDAADMLFDADSEKAREKMNSAAERMRAGLDSIRQAVRVLDHESSVIPVSDLADELEAVSDSFIMDTEMKAESIYSDLNDSINVPHEHAEFLTGALREIMSNGVRHGNADHFYIKLEADSAHIRMTVSDNGTSSFSEANSEKLIRNGFGLKKLISYAEKCGGSAEFKNDGGFISVITLPLYQEEYDG